MACLLRHFPPAQSQFAKLGGLQVLVELFQAQGAEVLCVRIITLLYDLITEQVIIGANVSEWILCYLIIIYKHSITV